MSYFVYIIQSSKSGRYYIGSSRDPLMRLERHNAGWTRSTKSENDWRLMYTEAHENRNTATKRERKIKRMKSRKYIERLLHSGGRPDPTDREVSSAPPKQF